MKTIKAWTLNGIYLLIYALMMPLIIYRRITKGRPFGNFRERVLGLAPRVAPEQHCVWLHAVSVGEVNLLDTLLEHLQQRYPESHFVISTTTATGMHLAKAKHPEFDCFYFPIDFSWAIRNVLRRVAPDLVVLTELEIWPNLVGITHDKKIPVAVVNGRLSEKSFHGYLKRKRLVGPTFARIDSVVAQTGEYAARFVQLGCPAERVSVAGSIKFDGAFSKPDQGLMEKLGYSLGIDDGDILLVAGSTQAPEEQMIARIWLTLVEQRPELRLVIVPRHPHRGVRIQTHLKRLGVDAQLQSRSDVESLARDQVLIADTIGELKAWWSLANIAFVGGSFGDRGGQNMIEPAAAGAVVCFGPNTWNFKQVVNLMLSNDVATQVHSEDELLAFIDKSVTDVRFATARGNAARELVESSQGAVATTCQMLDRYFITKTPPTTNRDSKAA